MGLPALFEAGVVTRRYRHKTSGKIYDLLFVANENATRESWPELAIYRDINQKIWARPYEEFLERCERVE